MLKAAILPGGGRAFFDGSSLVLCRIGMYFMAAASCQPPHLPALPRHSFGGIKERQL